MPLSSMQLIRIPAGRIAAGQRLKIRAAGRVSTIGEAQVNRRIAVAAELAAETGFDELTCAEVLRRLHDDRARARTCLENAKDRHAAPLADLPG